METIARFHSDLLPLGLCSSGGVSPQVSCRPSNRWPCVTGKDGNEIFVNVPFLAHNDPFAVNWALHCIPVLTYMCSIRVCPGIFNVLGNVDAGFTERWFWEKKSVIAATVISNARQLRSYLHHVSYPAASKTYITAKDKMKLSDKMRFSSRFFSRRTKQNKTDNHQRFPLTTDISFPENRFLFLLKAHLAFKCLCSSYSDCSRL